MGVRPSIFSRRVFVDSSAYYALSDLRSGQHGLAVQRADRVATERRPLFTSNFVLAETHALLLSRLGRAIALDVVTHIAAGSTTVVRVSASDERRAWEIVRLNRDKDISFTDATSFAVMERLHIGAAFTFDSDFEQAGFAAV